MKTILLAGATGTLGKALIPALAAGGYTVIALARPKSQERLAPMLDYIAETRFAQITDANTLQGICDGVDVVVSTIGITRQMDGLTYENVDYGANLNLLRETERAGVRRFLYVSVLGADQQVGVPVIDAKHKFEQALQSSSLDWTIIRPSGFYTDILDVFKMAKQGTVYQFGSGENQISPVDVGDLARIITGLIDGHEKNLNVGGPETLSWNKVADLCFDVLGKRSRIIHVPAWILNVLLIILRPISFALFGTLSFLGYVQTHETVAPNLGMLTVKKFLLTQK